MYGDVSFKADTPLYCDWAHLSRKKGGVKSVGAGFIASLSVGWSKSLWSSFREKVERTSAALGQVSAAAEATVARYPSFFDGVEPLQMEGCSWRPALFSGERPAASQAQPAAPWLLAYLRDDCFMFPWELWGRIAHPIHAYGEVVPIEVHTGFGQASCFLKVRAAAYVGT